MIHYQDVHSELCEGERYPEVTDMTEDDDTVDKENIATEDVNVQIGDIEPLFKSAIEICPSQYKWEFELDLWTNRPDTEDEAINRAIILRARETPQMHSPL